MEESKFVTTTEPKLNLVYLSIIALPFMLLLLAAMYLFPLENIYILLALMLICVSLPGTGVILAVSPPVTLQFKDDELHIHDTTGKEFNVYATPAGDFVFIQTTL